MEHSGEGRKNAIQLFKSTPACELVRHARPLVFIDTETSIDQALQLLREHNILSLPVFDKSKNKYTGIVTIGDLLNYVAFGNFTEEGLVSEQFDNGHKPAAGIMQERDPELPVASVSDTIDDLLEYFSKGWHRLLVRVPFDPTEENLKAEEKDSELRMVTQSDVVKFALQNVNAITDSEVFGKSVKDLGLVKDKICTMTDVQTALEGFAKMASNDVNAIAVVDDNKKIIATISSSDLRGLTSNVILKVKLPVIKFLKERSLGYIRPPCVCQEDVKFGDALNKMALCKVHRLWIENKEQQVVGVLSMSDCCKILFNNGQ